MADILSEQTVHIAGLLVGDYQILSVAGDDQTFEQLLVIRILQRRLGAKLHLLPAAFLYCLNTFFLTF
jgi:hypothetical protein